MAIKQAGVVKIKGRIGSDLVGYQMKGVSGVLVRTFDGEKISDNVKNSANYANTRKNNAEFGSACSNAKGLYNAIPQRWRTVLAAFVLAKIQRDLLKLTRETDTTSDYGQRVLKFTPTLLTKVPGIVDGYSKKDFNEYAASSIDTDLIKISADAIKACLYYQGGEYDGINFYTSEPYKLNCATIADDGTVEPSELINKDPGKGAKRTVTFASLADATFDYMAPLDTTGTESAPAGELEFQYICAVPFKTINGTQVEFINEACMRIIP